MEELCEQLKENALSDRTNDNIRITCHQNNNNSISNKNKNQTSIDNNNIDKMSETNESNEAQTQPAEGERPSFLVSHPKVSSTFS